MSTGPTFGEELESLTETYLDRLADCISLGVRGLISAATRRTTAITRFADNIKTGQNRVVNTQTFNRNKGTLLELVSSGVRAYSGLCGEVVFEMAFDNMMSMNQQAQPFGGARTFMMAVTASIVLQGVMNKWNKRGIDMIESGVQPKPSYYKIRTALTTGALALQFSIVMMRMPVMASNSVWAYA